MRCFRFIAAEKAQFPISLLCRVLGVSRSGFYAWQGRNSSERALAGAWLCEPIREIAERAAPEVNTVIETGAGDAAELLEGRAARPARRGTALPAAAGAEDRTRLGTYPCLSRHGGTELAQGRPGRC